MTKLCMNMNMVIGTVKMSILVVVIFNLLSISHCRRLSFKESLTAFTEEPIEQSTSTTSENPKHLPASSTPSSLSTGAVFTDIISGHSKNSPSGNGERKFSLLEITKNILFPSLKKESNNNIISKVSGSTLNSSSMSHNNGTNGADDNSSYYKDSTNGIGKVAAVAHHDVPGRTKESPHQAWQNFLTTVKNEVEGIKGKWDDKNRKNSNISKPLQKVRIFMKEDDDSHHHQHQQLPSPLRSKKEVSSNSGLRDLLWNTATALWSVNKVHFLPTFLHTKTGGKLSLIRDSIFKPVAILSQFTNGIQEINNEKWSNLARLTHGGGWTRPPKSQVVVIKVHPENSGLWTLARYLFKLTKHTTITKWRLKKALLDLQLRALRKLPSKLATIKILTNAILRGKLSLLKILTGRNNNHTHYYPGKDHSSHVDITYSSLNSHDHNHDQKPNNWLNYHQHHEYEPPSSEFLPFRPMSPTGAPPKKINYYHYETPILGESSHSVSVIPPPPAPEPLIDSPSYANLLETMGIHPTSYDYDGASKNIPITTTTTTPAPALLSPSPSSPPPPSPPAPTVVYYSSKSNTPTTFTTTTSNTIPYESLLIEKPAASYAFHLSSDGSSNHLDASHPHSSSLRSYLSSFPPLEANYSPYGSKTEETTSSGTGSVISTGSASSTTSTSQSNPSPFRLKLLQSMEGVLHRFLRDDTRA